MTDISQWLLGFSLFLFLSLGFAKRYVELAHVANEDAHGLVGRGYAWSDAQPVLLMGIASGYAAVVVFALYLASPAVLALYVHPALLWLSVPTIAYWVSWLWLSAHRGTMNEDPVVFPNRQEEPHLHPYPRSHDCPRRSSDLNSQS